MIKKYAWLTILTALILAFGSIVTAQAEIIPPSGEGQIGLVAYVLCETLTVREAPNTSSKTVMILEYGDHILVTNQDNGWARIVRSDSIDAPYGWVNADYIAIDPARYRTESKTPVYAWTDVNAPKVALLDKGTILPILKDTGSWLIVSLRGAAGCIRK